MEWWQSIIISLTGLGVIGDLIAHLLLPATRRSNNAGADKAEAEANAKEWELEEARIKQLHDTVLTLNDLLKTQADRIVAQNAALDAKTDLIRERTNMLIESERALNVANATITRLTEERDEERRLKDRYKEWHCRSNICQPGKPDPDGRRPPNPNILGKQFKTD